MRPVLFDCLSRNRDQGHLLYSRPKLVFIPNVIQPERVFAENGKDLTYGRVMKLTETLFISLVTTCLLLPAATSAQEFYLELEASSSLGAAGGGINTLILSQAQGASDGFVQGEDEYSTPPANNSAFHSWISIDGQEWKTCRRSPSNTDLVCVIGLNFYQTNPILLQWNSADLPNSGSFTLEDAFGGGVLFINLKEQDSILIDNIALTNLVLRITPPIQQNFMRGDVNVDSSFNMSDVITSLGNLFQPDTVSPILCRKAADVNDDGGFNLSDPIYGLYFLFNGGPAPVTPFPECSQDPTPDPLDCAQSCL